MLFIGHSLLLTAACGTVRSATMDTIPFEGCTNVQKTFSGTVMECVSYAFQNKKACQKIRTLQQLPLRNVFLSVAFVVLVFFPPKYHKTFLHELS